MTEYLIASAGVIDQQTAITLDGSRAGNGKPLDQLPLDQLNPIQNGGFAAPGGGFDPPVATRNRRVTHASRFSGPFNPVGSM